MTRISSSLLVNGAADYTIIQTKNYRNNNNSHQKVIIILFEKINVLRVEPKMIFDKDLTTQIGLWVKKMSALVCIDSKI